MERKWRPRPSAPAASGLNELRARFDKATAKRPYQALQLALDELGDGVTLVWRRPARGLVGKIKPVSAFRDDKGRVCRHVVYSLSLGGYEKEIEGNACREVRRLLGARGLESDALLGGSLWPGGRSFRAVNEAPSRHADKALSAREVEADAHCKARAGSA